MEQLNTELGFKEYHNFRILGIGNLSDGQIKRRTARQEKKDIKLDTKKAALAEQQALTNAINAPAPEGMGTGAIIGISVGALAVVGLIIFLIKRK